MVSEKTLEKIRSLAKEPIVAVFTDPTYGKVDTVLQYDILKPYIFFLVSIYYWVVVSFPHKLSSHFLHQFERGEALDKITQDVKRTLEEECDEEGLKVLSKTVDTVRKEVWVYILSQLFVL